MDKRLALLITLTLFVMGLTVGSVAATHEVKVGKYVGKLTDSQYNSLKNAEKKGIEKTITLNTGKYYKYKKPKYKYKKVKKTKWVYKKVLASEDWWARDFSWSRSETYKGPDKYWKSSKWKYYGTKSVNVADNHIKHYTIFKRKAKVTVKKKVRNGYKIAKDPIKMYVTYSPGGMVDAGYSAIVDSVKYFEKYDKYIAWVSINL